MCPSMPSPKILLGEDEQAIANPLIYALGSEGFRVRLRSTGKLVDRPMARRPD